MKKVAAWAASVLLLLALAGCSGGETGSADLNQVMDDMKAVLENTEMMDLSQEDLMPQYGIDASQVKQFAVYIDSTGLKGDEIVLLEGTDSQAAAALKEKMDERYRQKENTMKDYQPEEFAMLQACSVEQRGSYVSMIVSPQHEELEKIYEEAFA
ncbi:MAG TPA: DUF4358 domain-containing protein [Candidatus Caccousia avistercoris]|nr:DUF4358 domain-containing protein [Candidatus Caccousia avistercoris]